MKVLTIKQPWASLIISGYKEYEFRTWKTNYRGDILIHAGKSVDKKAMKRFEHLKLTYPTGCIIGKINITDCIIIDNDVANKLFKKDSLVYAGLKGWTGYGFKLENVRKIDKIYINGQLGFWNYDISI